MTHDPAFPADLVAALQTDTPAIDASALARIQGKLALSIGAAPASPESGAEHLVSATTAAVKGSTTLLAIGFAIGTGVGAAGHALLTSPAEKIVYRERVVEVRVPSAAPTAAASEAPAQATPAPTVDTKPVARPSAAPTAVAEVVELEETDEGLSAELSLLDQARKALGAGDARRSLETLEMHAKRYAASRLEQEREALRVKALIGAGRHAEARAQGERFRRRFPKSMLLDSVEKALSSIP